MNTEKLTRIKAALQRVAETKEAAIKVGDTAICKASYCGGDNPACSEASPCPDCWEMCNRFVIGDEHYGRTFFFGTHHCSRTNSCLAESNSSYCTTHPYRDGDEHLEGYVPFDKLKVEHNLSPWMAQVLLATIEDYEIDWKLTGTCPTQLCDLVKNAPDDL